MGASGIKLIDASGHDGRPALEFTNGLGQAPCGRHGRHGRSAGSPTTGAPGSDIAVRLAYCPNRPAEIQVFGQRAAEFWSIARGETLLLRADGGNGGAGGRGQHGQDGGPGRDGRDANSWDRGEDGGDGGNGGDPNPLLSKDGGRPGRPGCKGYRPFTHLRAGRHGADGRVQIKVNRGPDTSSTYPGVYKLEVVKFNITDENRDGINEPGEHISVHNLVVRNVGLMPSPATRSIHVLIQGTQYLEPVSSQPLQLPFGIRPGQEVEVPGLLRALIRDRGYGEPMGELAGVNDWVQLVGVFHERLHRPIPGFCSLKTPIRIRYPLVLDPPVFLRSVAKGDRVRFRWQLHNKSRKAYGFNTDRPCATSFSETQVDEGARIVLSDISQGFDQIDEIQPLSTMTIDQEFTVNDKVEDFIEALLSVQLHLSDPQTRSMRTVQEHHMPVQISCPYQRAEDSEYLLIVNSRTSNHAIRQTLDFLRHRLHMGVDVFNLSVYGSYNIRGSDESVLSQYPGKSIIVFGNGYEHPGAGWVKPWELIDPWAATELLKSGTSLHLANVFEANLPDLQSWTEGVVFPTHRFSLGADRYAFCARDAKTLATDLQKPNVSPLASTKAYHELPVTKSPLNVFRSLKVTLNCRAKMTAKEMAQKLPLRRFFAAPDFVAYGGGAPKKKGHVLVIEGVPRTAKMTATTAPSQEFLSIPRQTGSLSDHDAFLLISSLPFSTRVRKFWDTIYCASPPSSKAGADELPILDRKALQAVTISLQFDLCNEIYWITAGNNLPAEGMLSQIPLTSCFFDSAPRGDLLPIQQVEEAQLLVLALGTIHAVSNPLSPWKSVQATFASLGKRQLSHSINDLIFGAVQRTCAPCIAGTVKSHVLARSEQVKRGIRSQPKKEGGLPNSYTGYGYQDLGVLTNNTSGWVDLLAPGETNLALTGQEAQDRADCYRARKEDGASLHEASRQLIESMVNL
ncbi:hypothetical protein PG993_003723 [Apiospora rasikravindrae]|uniref:DUF7932 domain-containing protein n=1 Tax=Apiospora rasikravindrae TaxID=990691 RepID=A0ABR1U314_9PEZI